MSTTEIDRPRTIVSHTSDPYADLRWEPRIQPARYTDLDGDVQESRYARILVHGRTNEELGSVGMRYTPLPNAHKVELWERLESKGLIHKGRAHSWNDGRTVSLQGQTNGTIEINNQPIFHYIGIMDYYGVPKAVRFTDRAVRQVCTNGMVARFGREQNVRIRHDCNINTHFRVMCDAIEGSVRRFQTRTASLFRQLASTPMTDREFQDYRNALFALPSPPPADATAKANDMYIRARSAAQATRDAVLDAYHNAPGAEPGTRWGAYNAVTRVLTHGDGYRRETPTRRMRRGMSNLDGDALRDNERALTLLATGLN